MPSKRYDLGSGIDAVNEELCLPSWPKIYVHLDKDIYCKKIQLVNELINVKHDELVLDNLSKEEVDEIIEFLCTS